MTNSVRKPAAPTMAEPVTRFIISVDVESRTYGHPCADIWGYLRGHEGEYGIGKIMDILEAHDVRGTFFVNVYEMAKYGEEAIRDVTLVICERGHDVELHTHPRPMYGVYAMSYVPLEMQREIVEKGVATLEKWTGHRPVAHRAGTFLANSNTLEACAQVGLAADSSLSSGSKVTDSLVNFFGTSNMAKKVGGLWEIPVTYYEQLRCGPLRPKRVLDVEASSLREMKAVTRWAIKNEIPTVCMLMHSFSLSRRGVPNRRVIRRLVALLLWLKQQDMIAIDTIEQVCRRLDANGVPEKALPAPITGFWLTWLRVLSSWNDGWKNGLGALIGVVVLAGLLIIPIYLAWLMFRW